MSLLSFVVRYFEGSYFCSLKLGVLVSTYVELSDMMSSIRQNYIHFVKFMKY